MNDDNTTNNKAVAIVGWNPDVLDYSDWPELSAEKVRSALEHDRDQLNDLGYQASLLYIQDADSAAATVTQALQNSRYDCILVGAGVRIMPQHFIVFEQLINVVHQYAPDAKICFNTNPSDTAAAVQRWL